MDHENFFNLPPSHLKNVKLILSSRTRRRWVVGTGLRPWQGASILDGQRRATLPTVKARMNPSLPVEGSREITRRERLFRDEGAGGCAAPSRAPPRASRCSRRLFSLALSLPGPSLRPPTWPGRSESSALFTFYITRTYASHDTCKAFK